MYKLIKCSTTVIKTLGAELILMKHSVEVALINIIFKQKKPVAYKVCKIIRVLWSWKYSHPYSY